MPVEQLWTEKNSRTHQDRNFALDVGNVLILLGHGQVAPVQALLDRLARELWACGSPCVVCWVFVCVFACVVFVFTAQQPLPSDAIVAVCVVCAS